MKWLLKVVARIGLALSWKRRACAELDEEIRSHIEMRAQQLRENGMNAEEARAAACRQFGWAESVREACRDETQGRCAREASNIVGDIGFASRMLVKNRGFAFAAVGTLALGICAVTTQFSVLYGVLLRGVPFPNPDRLVHITVQDASTGETRWSAPSIDDFYEWQLRQRSCEGLAASDVYRWLNVAIQGAPMALSGAFVTPNFFSLLGVAPVLGRDFSRGDGAPGATPVVLISHSIWMRDFGGNPDVVGRSLRLEGRAATIIGVMPPHFAYPEHQEIWAPLIPLRSAGRPRGQTVGVLARLNPGASMDQAAEEFGVIARSLAQEFPEAGRPMVSARVRRLQDDLAEDRRAILTAMLAAAGAVLLIACMNVMNLQFVRASSRLREMAMRGALGASIGRLLRQGLTEGLVLVVWGGGLGLIITHWTIRLLRAALAELRFGSVPSWVVTDMNLGIAAFVFFIIAVVLVLSCLAPALMACRADPIAVLKQGARGESHPLVQRLGHISVVGQIAVTGALLVAALLQLKSITKHATVDMGFDPGSFLAGRLNLDQKYPTPEARSDFYRRFLLQARSNPEFSEVALTLRSLAIGDDLPGRFRIESIEAGSVAANLEYISDRYFAALGLRPVAGREFHLEELGPSERPALINSAFANKHFSGVNPLGRRIAVVRGDDGPEEWRTIVGVMPDTHLEGFGDRTIGSAGVFLPMEAGVCLYPTVVIRGGRRPEALAEPLRRSVASFDPDLTLYSLATPRVNLRAINGEARMTAILSSIFAGAATGLALTGIYGVASFSVSQRRKELGIRMALGAGRSGVVKMIMGEGGRQFALGSALAVCLSLALARLGAARFPGFLYGVSFHDPVVYLSVGGLLALGTSVACFFPAWRASRIDPASELRGD